MCCVQGSYECAAARVVTSGCQRGHGRIGPRSWHSIRLGLQSDILHSTACEASKFSKYHNKIWGIQNETWAEAISQVKSVCPVWQLLVNMREASLSRLALAASSLFCANARPNVQIQERAVPGQEGQEGPGRALSRSRIPAWVPRGRRYLRSPHRSEAKQKRSCVRLLRSPHGGAVCAPRPGYPPHRSLQRQRMLLACF